MQINISRIKFLILALCIILPSIFINTSCLPSKMTKKERQIQREKEKRRKEDTVLYQKALKQHMKNQSRETQRRMRQNSREAERFNEQRKEFFLSRWIKEWNHRARSRHRG